MVKIGILVLAVMSWLRVYRTITNGKKRKVRFVRVVCAGEAVEERGCALLLSARNLLRYTV